MRAGQTIVPQGGLTGLAGGATPRAGDIVLSLERIAGIEEIDTAAATMTVRRRHDPGDGPARRR